MEIYYSEFLCKTVKQRESTLQGSILKVENKT